MIKRAYYPFGLKHKGYNYVINGTDHPYGFGGKEEQDELGLGWMDFHARNYDATLGRWMNLDPLAEKYESWSPYNNTLNNPIYFVDPDGEQITIHYEDEKGKSQTLVYNYGDKYKGDNQFLKDVFSSFNYLIENDLGDIIKDVAGKKENIDLKEGETLDDFNYNIDTNTLKYHPRSGLETTEGGKQSPALGLLHELGHAQSDLKDEKAHKERRSKPSSDGKYSNKEEERVIKTIENPAAQKLGQSKRYNHRGTTYTTASPTTTMSAETATNNTAFKAHKEAKRKEKSISPIN